MVSIRLAKTVGGDAEGIVYGKCVWAQTALQPGGTTRGTREVSQTAQRLKTGQESRQGEGGKGSGVQQNATIKRSLLCMMSGEYEQV
jgi:hypothetical protein